MQTKEQKEKPVAEEWTGRGLSPKQMEQKQKLQQQKARDPNKKLPKAFVEKLDELLAIEKAEYDRQAAIHKLSSAADTYGRKETARIRRAVTDRVKEINKKERVEVGGIQKIYKKGRAELEKGMKAAMRRVQEQHNKAMAEMEAEEEKNLAEVRGRFKEGYDQASSDIECDTNAVAITVATFIEDIQDLELEQLQVLETDGVLQNGSNENATFIVVPGAPEAKPA